ncbi:MAG TPA: hypothetical protein VKQ72_01545, partial [Aggregatilineales bacterium]|nr:hypothetical protein [Aggregatilineales bacterium]
DLYNNNFGTWLADGFSTFSYQISDAVAGVYATTDDPVVGHFDYSTPFGTGYSAPKPMSPATPAPTQPTAPNYVPPSN